VTIEAIVYSSLESTIPQKGSNRHVETKNRARGIGQARPFYILSP
jgi:hypothetical protein